MKKDEMRMNAKREVLLGLKAGMNSSKADKLRSEMPAKEPKKSESGMEMPKAKKSDIVGASEKKEDSSKQDKLAALFGEEEESDIESHDDLDDVMESPAEKGLSESEAWDIGTLDSPESVDAMMKKLSEHKMKLMKK